MYKKVALIFPCFMLVAYFSQAQTPDYCKMANDSMKVQFARGELGCFVTAKGMGNINHIKIFKTHYEKTIVKTASKDSISQQKLEQLQKKLAESGKTGINKDTSGKIKKFIESKIINPLDTSTEFKLCYNKAFQAKLDSAFKCDFFRKSDSILKSYDKLGKGYKNVEFKGGPVELQKFMDKNIILPKDAKSNSDSDKVIRVYYQFFVDEKGMVSEPKLIKSNCKVCEEPVLAAIKILPAFIPATDAGKPKKVKYIFPYTKAATKAKE